MTYKVYDTTQGRFCIDWDTCCQIIRSYHRSASQLSNTADVTESQRGLNPLSWGLPDLTYLDVNWDQVHRETEEKTLAAAWRMAATASFDRAGIDRLVSDLQGMQTETRKANTVFSRRQRDASKKSWAAMSESIDNYQQNIDRAKMVRDASGSILIGAATVATGGAASVALVAGGLGTGLKTYAKYQDTGNLGVAAIEATQNIVICIIPAARGAKLAGSEKVMKIVLGAVLDTDKALLEGREVTTAVEEGAISAGVAVVGEKGKEALGGILKRTAVPIVAKVLQTSTKVTSDYLTGIVKKVGEDRAKKTLQNAVKNNAAAKHEIGRSVTDSNSWDSVLSFGDQEKMLLKFAIIDMEQGVGRSWW